MVYENIATMLNAVTLLFALITLIMTAKNREFERGEVENTVNALLFGFFIMMLIMVIRIVESLDGWMHDQIINSIPQITTYVGYLTQIEILALAPLLAICFLVAMFLAKDLLEK